MGLGGLLIAAGEIIEKRGTNYFNSPDRYVGCTDEGYLFLVSLQVPDEWLSKECILYIDYRGYGFDFGNAIKYLWRLGSKPNLPGYTPRFVREFALVQDLKKAKYYITRAYQNKTINDRRITEEHIQKVVEIITIALEKPQLISDQRYDKLNREAENALYFKRANTQSASAQSPIQN